jgi:hypothetical protein
VCAGKCNNRTVPAEGLESSLAVLVRALKPVLAAKTHHDFARHATHLRLLRFFRVGGVTSVGGKAAVAPSRVATHSERELAMPNTTTVGSTAKAGH